MLCYLLYLQVCMAEGKEDSILPSVLSPPVVNDYSSFFPSELSVKFITFLLLYSPTI